MMIVSALGPLKEIRAAADAIDALDPSPAEAVSWFEEDPGKFRLEIYVADPEAIDLIAELVRGAAPSLHPHAQTLGDADWVAMALEGLPAVKAGRFVVAGAHALARRRGGAKKLWIEASEAFGTGHHGTTWGCLTAFEGLLQSGFRPKTCLDIGAGSGVLALAASRIGAKSLAVEIDARAAEIGRTNIRNNRLACRMRMQTGDGGKIAAGARSRPYDLVFANILMRPLIRLAPAIAGAVKPGGRLILSGLILNQAPLVLQAYASRGFRLQRRLRKETWATLVLVRTSRAAA